MSQYYHTTTHEIRDLDPDLNDQKGGLTITNNNGAAVANHPRVYA